MQVKQEKRNNVLIRHLIQCGIAQNYVLDALTETDLFKLNQNLAIDVKLDAHYNFQDRKIMSPILLVKLLNLLKPNKNDKILEILPANFYSTLILARLANHVTSVETKQELINNFTSQGLYKKFSGKISIKNKIAKGTKFDKIIIYGAINNLDKNLLTYLDNMGILIYIHYENAELHNVNNFATVKIVKKEQHLITEKIAFTTQIFSLTNEIKNVYN